MKIQRHRMILIAVTLMGIGLLVIASQFMKLTPTQALFRNANIRKPQVMNEAIVPTKRARQAVLQTVTDSFSTPIIFYGRIIDQHGEPVANATVDLTTITSWQGAISARTEITDKDGLISVKGMKGINLMVTASKDGYFTDPNVSSVTFGYGISADSHRLAPPSKESPAVLILHKLVEPQQLIIVPSESYAVPDLPEFRRINLLPDSEAAAWISVSKHIPDKSNEPYDWTYHIHIPGGAIAAQSNRLDFHAPNMYSPNMTMHRSKDLGTQWDSRATEFYFIRFDNERYGRFRFRFFGGQRDSIAIEEGYINPEPGNRNLELLQ